MSRSNLANDVRLVINGLLKVAKSGAAIQQAKTETILRNSSLRKAAENAPETLKKILPSDSTGDMIQRASMIPVGIQQFASIAPKYILPEQFLRKSTPSKSESPIFEEGEEILTIREEDLEGLYIQSLGVELLQQNVDGRLYVQENQEQAEKDVKESQTNSVPNSKQNLKVDQVIDDILSSTLPLTESHKKPSKPKENDFLQSSVMGAVNHIPSNFESKPPPTVTSIPPPPSQINVAAASKLSSMIKPLSKNKPVSQLSKLSKQRKVPATRISRLVSYGGLAAGLGMGALAEVTKRSLGLTNPNSSGNSLLNSSPFLTEANAERIVDTLCRVRGAALKIGQILSIQDNSMINPQLQSVFERVRHAADFMPDWQMEKMLTAELGSDWRSKLAEFDPKPFAAASIGQVHLGKLHDGRPVAIKIQYPGVGQGINSDIDNLMSILGVWSIIPEGVFIDNIIDVAKRELAWEVDYIREAKCAKRFRKLLEPYPNYYVPDVVDELSTKQIYSTELIEGIPVDKCVNLDQETRNHVCFLMLDLFFRELFEFQFMQTDPNWANFLYNAETRQIGLLDFGSSRDYNNSFVDNYMRILHGAADGDRETILLHSRKIGFLSGYESKLMENAHIESVLLLGEALRTGDKPYDFGSQDLTKRIQRLVPVMVKERLVPPPEEIYSLHRKLSGVFLLCSKLKGKVICRPILERVMQNYQFDRPDTKSEINVN